MNHDVHQKVKASHLKRSAYLYVRQSSLRQVFENTESTQRQYGLREQAVTLGWPLDRIIVIDSDLGLSGASSDREGFRRLVTEVSLAHVGIVLGLEVSRLARNSTDWHRLLEICALTDTLILDEDGIYDPSHFNDRLLLGLKGTMSEAELHVLRARLQGGILNKARRGELMMRPPIGYAYDANARMVFDPDGQIQQAVRLVSRHFDELVPRWARYVPSGRKDYCFHGGSTPVPERAMSFGANWNTVMCSGCCTTRVTPASLSTDALVAARRSTVRLWCNTCRASSGMLL